MPRSGASSQVRSIPHASCGNLIIGNLAFGVLLLCHVSYDHRAACDHY